MKNNLEKRFFDFGIWLVALSVLLAILTGCSAAIPLPTTPTSPATTATRQLSQLAPIAPSPTPRVCIVSTGIDEGNLNLRTGASVAYSVIRTLNEGQRLNITDTPAKGIWIQVTTADNVTGWINSTYCKGV